MRFVAMIVWPAADFPLTISETRIASENIIDRILRYENLPAELGELFSQANIFDGTLGVAAKSEYRIPREISPLICFSRD